VPRPLGKEGMADRLKQAFRHMCYHARVGYTSSKSVVMDTGEPHKAGSAEARGHCLVSDSRRCWSIIWSGRSRGPSSMSVAKVIRGSHNFEIRSRDPDHAHLGVVLWSERRRDPSSISIPNLKPIAQFVQKLQKLLRGSQNLEIRSRDPGHAH